MVNHGESLFFDGENPRDPQLGGTWNRRPSGVSTMWRLLNLVDTERPWTVTGLAFYADEVPLVVVVSWGERSHRSNR